MNKNVRLCLVAFVLFLVSFGLNAKIQRFCENGGECGILMAWIYDEMGKPVDSKFLVYLYDFASNSNEARFVMNTNADGTLNALLPIGKYYILFAPSDRKSNKYSFDPDPTLNPRNRQLIEVKKDHITRTKKIVKPGGMLKIILVDENDNKILPTKEFSPDSRINCILHSSEVALVYYAEQGSDDDFSDGELLINCLFPSTYEVFFNFPNMGYGTQKYSNVKVERSFLTELRVFINKNDSTGISGRVINQDGLPMPDVEVEISTLGEKKYILDYAETITDSNGIYKIIGLKEKKYTLSAYKKINERRMYVEIKDISVKSNSIYKKNIVLNLLER